MFKDIDSDRPMMQVGPYVFAGEYEGKYKQIWANIKNSKNSIAITNFKRECHCVLKVLIVWLET